MTTTDARTVYLKSYLRLLIGFLCLVSVAYVPAFQAGYIWDDDMYVLENATLRSFEGLRQIWTDFEATPQYYPVVHTTFWIEYHLWGINPIGYHTVNIVIQGLNAWLVFVLLRKLHIPGAALAAALFAVHPVHVESVAWITERKNVLSMLFYLCSAITYFSFRPLADR